MTIQKANTINFFRYLAIFCAITMGFFCIVATSEDDVADLVGWEFTDEEVEVELEDVTVEKTADIKSLTESDCDTFITVREVLEAAIKKAEEDKNWDVSIGIKDINTVDLDYMEAAYTANWDPDSGPITCTARIIGDGENPTAKISETAENGLKDAVLVVEQDALDAINWYLDNIDAKFKVCADCINDGGVESYSVSFDVDIHVLISGEV